MVRKVLVSDFDRFTWLFQDIDTGDTVYYVGHILSDGVNPGYVKFGKVGGDSHVHTFHTPYLASEYFRKISDELTTRLIQRGELDLSEVDPIEFEA